MRQTCSLPAWVRKPPVIFCCTHEHAQIALGLIVVKGHGKVVQEGKRLSFADLEALEQDASERLFPGTFDRWLAVCSLWRIGRPRGWGLACHPCSSRRSYSALSASELNGSSPDTPAALACSTRAFMRKS